MCQEAGQPPAVGGRGRAEVVTASHLHKLHLALGPILGKDRLHRHAPEQAKQVINIVVNVESPIVSIIHTELRKPLHLLLR